MPLSNGLTPVTKRAGFPITEELPGLKRDGLKRSLFWGLICQNSRRVGPGCFRGRCSVVDQSSLHCRGKAFYLVFATRGGRSVRGGFGVDQADRPTWPGVAGSSAGGVVFGNTSCQVGGDPGIVASVLAADNIDLPGCGRGGAIGVMLSGHGNSLGPT